jgi:hypothetical protein
MTVRRTASKNKNRQTFEILGRKIVAKTLKLGLSVRRRIQIER